MSALCFILMLLIFVTIPTLIYTICHILKGPPNALLSAPPPRAHHSPSPSPSPKEVVRSMELVTVVNAAGLEEAPGDCPVCLSSFEHGEELWQLKLCSHLFHAPCIEPWLHARSSCPLCRAYVLFPNRSLLVPAAARQDDLWQGLSDSYGLV